MKYLTPLNWIDAIKNSSGMQTPIDNYCLISNDIKTMPIFPYLMKVPRTFIIFCTKGELHCTVGHKLCVCNTNSMLIVEQNEIYQFLSKDEDFEGWIFILSSELEQNMFTDIQQRQSLLLSTFSNPVIHLSREEININIEYCKFLRKVLGKDNTHIKEIVTHLLLALYYQQHNSFPLTMKKEGQMTKQKKTFSQFIKLVEKNFRNQRKIVFYADKMALTPKYLAQIIKDVSDKSAKEWIDDYVMLEARALLTSSDLTIHQISDKLSFNDPSSFGKYFKAHYSISPKEYREKTQ